MSGLVKIVPHPKGRRCYLLSHRLHHAHVGLFLIVQGVRLVVGDWGDRPWWPSREGR